MRPPLTCTLSMQQPPQWLLHMVVMTFSSPLVFSSTSDTIDPFRLVPWAPAKKSAAHAPSWVPLALMDPSLLQGYRKAVRAEVSKRGQPKGKRGLSADLRLLVGLDLPHPHSHFRLDSDRCLSVFIGVPLCAWPHRYTQPEGLRFSPALPSYNGE
jgi:hypothetical protein